jgi:hypothetical protein
MTKDFWFSCSECNKTLRRSSVDSGEVICPNLESRAVLEGRAVPGGALEIADGLVWAPPLGETRGPHSIVRLQ